LRGAEKIGSDSGSLIDPPAGIRVEKPPEECLGIDHPREVIEPALAHVVRNRVEAAYARSDVFERRRFPIDDWARYLALGLGEDLE